MKRGRVVQRKTGSQLDLYSKSSFPDLSPLSSKTNHEIKCHRLVHGFNVLIVMRKERKGFHLPQRGTQCDGPKPYLHCTREETGAIDNSETQCT